MPPTFAQLGVPQPICTALERRGITKPFEIQAATITDGLAGRDICGRAPTGSGKTIAFGIPIVTDLGQAKPKQPRALILAPTRELADQIHTELRTFGGSTRIGVVYGGVGYGNQIRDLRRGIDVLVACPGRLEDLIDQGVVSLSQVERVVVDEADRMADMGFMPAVRRLLDQTSSNRQTLLFSATLDGDVAELTRRYQHDPVRHEVGEETPDITAAHHVFWKVKRLDRSRAVADAIGAAWPTIVFCRTRHGSDRLAKKLIRDGIQAATIHGGRSQNQRTRALADFAGGRIQALVATDVAARGIHVADVASVVHYDLPEDHKAYVHRSGRTARAGRGGLVLSLVQPDQLEELRQMQRQVGLKEPVTDPDFKALRELSPLPARTLAQGGSTGSRTIVEGPRKAHSSGQKTNNGRRGPGNHAKPNNRSKTKNRKKSGQSHSGGQAGNHNRSSHSGSGRKTSKQGSGSRRSRQQSRSSR